MIFDTHMHCRYSIDSKMNIDEAKAAAEKLGIGMIITEHWDEDYPTGTLGRGLPDEPGSLCF